MKNSIQYKILFSFSLVIVLSITSLIYLLTNTLNKNTEYVLNKELIEAKKNLDIYLKQYFLINNMDANKIAFRLEGANISKELTIKINSSVLTYDSDGNILSELNNEDSYKNNLDLSSKNTKDIYYSINRLKDKVVVSLFYPVKSNNTTIGFIEYNKDYSQFFQSNENILTMLQIFSVCIFIVIFIVSYFISKTITKPIKSLTDKSIEISNGNLNVDIPICSKDEIGKLAYNFKLMVSKLKDQIDIIKRDRDTLKEIQSQKKVFFDNVTHELKTPITTILGYSQIIKDNGFNDIDFFNKATSKIISESSRLNRMVIDLLELSKSNSDDFRYDFENINLSELIKSTCEEMNIKSKKYNISIVYSVENNLFINGNGDKIKEVFINLIDNSIKYGNVNSTIMVNGYNKNQWTIIEVIDSGEGISSQDIENIFQPFYRVSKNKSRERGSSGLGLSITKSIVEKHNGHIEIKSVLNKGTSVTIKFPKQKNNATIIIR